MGQTTLELLLVVLTDRGPGGTGVDRAAWGAWVCPGGCMLEGDSRRRRIRLSYTAPPTLDY